MSARTCPPRSDPPAYGCRASAGNTCPNDQTCRETPLPDNQNPILIVAAKNVAAKAGALLEADCPVEILGSPGSLERLLDAVGLLTPKAIVIDCDGAQLDWATAVHALSRQERQPPVIVLGRDIRKADLLTAFREGADAYLAKSALAEDLRPALEAVLGGRIFYRRGDADLLREHMRELELGEARNVVDVQNGIVRLTVREKEVFPLLADGLSIRETARTLGISPKTVETHKYHIMSKLGFDSMADFTKLAMIKDLIPL